MDDQPIIWVVMAGFYPSLLGIYSTEAKAQTRVDQHNAKELAGMLEYNVEYPGILEYSEEDMEQNIVRDGARIIQWRVDENKP